MVKYPYFPLRSFLCLLLLREQKLIRRTLTYLCSNGPLCCLLRIAQVSGSQTALRRDQFPAEPWIHFLSDCLEV